MLRCTVSQSRLTVAQLVKKFSFYGTRILTVSASTNNDVRNYAVAEDTRTTITWRPLCFNSSKVYPVLPDLQNCTAIWKVPKLRPFVRLVRAKGQRVNDDEYVALVEWYEHGENRSTVGSLFATLRFTTIHFYNPCPIRPNTPDLWYNTVATQASFL
jgi:hypothetical protein